MAHEATKLKDKFIALVSHDLRSPLSTIVGLLSSSQSKRGNSLEHDDIIHRVNAISTGLIEMTGKLLDISRLQTGALKVEKTNINLHDYISVNCANLKHLAEEKGVRFVTKIPSGESLLVDEHLFGEVIQNLALNAIKFCNSGDTVTIGYLNDGRPELFVSDTGVGMEKEYALKIFSHEEKTTSPGTHGETGTGLGLPLCKDIIEAHGGAISVDTKPNAGSTFTITLPAQKKLVLVVDDQEVHRSIIKDLLIQSLDVEVLEADSGETAIKAVEAVRPNLVISDVYMPCLGGFELVEAIKSNQAHRNMPIIMMSAWSSADDNGGETPQEKSRAAGVDDFVYKPISPEYFLPVVKRFVCSSTK